MVEGVGVGGGKDGGGGAVLSVILGGGIPGVAVEAGGTVVGVGDQVVVVVLIEGDSIISVHRVEQADGVGLIGQQDGVVSPRASVVLLAVTVRRGIRLAGTFQVRIWVSPSVVTVSCRSAKSASP